MYFIRIKKKKLIISDKREKYVFLMFKNVSFWIPLTSEKYQKLISQFQYYAWHVYKVSLKLEQWFNSYRFTIRQTICKTVEFKLGLHLVRLTRNYVWHRANKEVEKRQKWFQIELSDRWNVRRHTNLCIGINGLIHRKHQEYAQLRITVTDVMLDKISGQS